MTQIGHSAIRHVVRVPGTGGSVTLSWAALSHTGHHRTANEDSLLAAAPIFAVADGMGGHTAGDVASSAVVTRLAEQVRADFVGRQALEGALRSAVSDIGRCVGRSELGTGTTVTGLALTLVDGSPYWLVFNIGDSRVYQLADVVLQQLTIDHSIVQELLDSGAITQAEAEGHPDGHVITRAVGFNEEPTPDYWLIPIVPGSRLLVCSDGLTKELTEYGVRHYLGSAASPEEAADDLVNAALGNGGRDNVSVIVVDVLDSGGERNDG